MIAVILINKMKLIFLILFLCISLAGCDGVPDEMKPAHRVFNYMPKNGSPEYEQGWKQGCESGMSGMTNSFYQSFYVFKQDNSLLKNEVYYKAWKDSYDYCKGYVYGIVKEANMRRSLPHSRRHFIPEGRGTNVMGGLTAKKVETGSGALGWFDNMGAGLLRW